MADLIPQNELSSYRDQVSQWELKSNFITREFTYRDFSQAIAFVNRVAEIAEAEGHHPDIDIRWNKVTLTLSTHSKGGLTASDFDLAKEIDRIALGNA